MAVARLTAPWIWEVLKTNFPHGVARRALLDQFATLLVTPRSSPGAKGRLARRLYARLDALQRRGLVVVEEGIVRHQEKGAKKPSQQIPPALTPRSNKALFLALMAEDRGTPIEIRHARCAFIQIVVEEGWTTEQAAASLGIRADEAKHLVAPPKR